MEIIYKQIDDLIPYENNPRHNDQAVEMVAESIKQFGFKVPIIIDSNNVIVAGHTRQKAAKQLGITEVPCIVADDLTDEQIRAFRIVDNKTATIADWDWELLNVELDAITGIDMSIFELESVELADLEDIWVDVEDIDKPHKIRWKGGEAETTAEDEEWLTDKLSLWKQEKPKDSFVRWLVE